MQFDGRRGGRKDRGLGWNNRRSRGRGGVRRLGGRGLKPSGSNGDGLHLAHIIYPEGSGIARDHWKFHSRRQNGFTVSDLYLHRLGQHHKVRSNRRQRRTRNPSWWWGSSDWIPACANYGADRTQENRLAYAAGQDRVGHCVVFYPTGKMKSMKYRSDGKIGASEKTFLHYSATPSLHFPTCSAPSARRCALFWRSNLANETGGFHQDVERR